MNLFASAIVADWQNTIGASSRAPANIIRPHGIRFMNCSFQKYSYCPSPKDHAYSYLRLSTGLAFAALTA